jgi:hypothetical protein
VCVGGGDVFTDYGNFCIELRYNKNLQRSLNLLVTLQQSAC